MAATYPNLANLVSIGKTVENRDIWLIKVILLHKTKKLILFLYDIQLTANSGLAKKTAFLDFGIHAREWISPATGAYIINQVYSINILKKSLLIIFILQLLTTYSSGGDAKTILDTWELHIVPILNPDGYAYTHSTVCIKILENNRK